MTDITWEQAREKVRERWPDVRSAQVFFQWEIYTADGENLGLVVLGRGLTEQEAWLDAYARMTDTSPSPERMTSSQPVAQPAVELPPLDLNENDREKAKRRDAFNTLPLDEYAHETMTVLYCRERQLLTALAKVREFEDVDASQAAEMAALRSAKEKAEAERDKLISDNAEFAKLNDRMSALVDQACDAGEASEAENTRLRDALLIARGTLGKENFIDAIWAIDAALSIPATKKEG